MKTETFCKWNRKKDYKDLMLRQSYLSLHCFPMRPGNACAIVDHFFGPYLPTNSIIKSSSCLKYSKTNPVRLTLPTADISDDKDSIRFTMDNTINFYIILTLNQVNEHEKMITGARKRIIKRIIPLLTMVLSQVLDLKPFAICASIEHRSDP